MDEMDRDTARGLAGCLLLVVPQVVVVAASVAVGMYSGEAWVGVALFAALTGMEGLLWYAALMYAAKKGDR